jgi:hypothetical protein
MGSFWDQQKQIPSTKSKQKTKEQRELENGLSRLQKETRTKNNNNPENYMKAPTKNIIKFEA